MTTPGGVPNLPVGALTLDTLAAKLQDQSAAAMRQWANERMPSIFDTSNGGNVLSDLSPFGIITRIWAEVNSAIANADPADINGPEDIPPLLHDFIESLPVVGELVGLMEAIVGTYTGDDAVLLAIQQIFLPIRKLLQLVSGQNVGFPTSKEVTVGWVNLGSAITEQAENFQNFVASTGQATAAALGAALQILIGWQTAIPAHLLSGQVPLLSIPATITSQIAAALTSASPLNAANLTGLAPVASIPLLPANIFQPGQVFDINMIPSLTSGWAGTVAHDVVSGVQGFPSLGASLTTLADKIGIGAGLSGVGLNFAAIGNQLGFVRAKADSAAASADSASQLLANRAVNQPGYAAIDPTAFAAFDLLHAPWGNTPTYLPVTSANAPGSYIDATADALEKAIWWYGGSTTNVTGMFMHLYSVNPATGTRTWIWSSPNIIGSVSNTIGWNSTNIAALYYVNAKQGDKFYVEMSTTGPGTYQLLGISGHWLAQHPTVAVSGRGGIRVTSSTPIFESKGAAYQSPSIGASAGGTWLHPGISAAANQGGAIYIVANVQGNAPTSFTAKCGSANMNLVANVGMASVSGQASWQLMVYELLKPPSGDQTMTFTFGAAFSPQNCTVSVNSFVFTNCVGSGPVTSLAAQGGNAPALTTSTPVGQLALNVMGMSAGTAGQAFSGYSKTLLENRAAFGSGTAKPYLVGTSVGTGANQTYNASGAAITGNYQVWANLVLPLKGPLESAPTTANPTTGAGGVATSQNVPFFSLAGAAGPKRIAPQTTNITGSSWTVPSTAEAGDLIDLAGVGGGGSGSAPAYYTTYFGGGPGAWNYQTLVVGTDINPGVTINVTKGGGGPGSTDIAGGYGGASGGNTVFSWTDPLGNPRTLTCAGGPGGLGLQGPGSYSAGGAGGPGPGNLTPPTSAGITYQGGGGQPTYSQAGIYPGGASAAGGPYTPSGPGAPGAAWATYYR